MELATCFEYFCMNIARRGNPGGETRVGGCQGTQEETGDRRNPGGGGQGEGATKTLPCSNVEKKCLRVVVFPPQLVFLK